MEVPIFVDCESYLALPRDPQPWLIQHLIPINGLVNIYGKPKAGKSFACLGMAHAIASGQPDWLGFAVKKHGPVCYLQVDTPRGEWAERIVKMRAAGMDMNNIFMSDMSMQRIYPFNILNPDCFAELKKDIDELKPVVIFIDTIREAHDADENDSTAMRNVVTQLVAAARDSAIVLLSHARKDTMFTAAAGADIMNDARGSSYISGRMDTIIKMNTNNDHATSMEYRGRSVGKGRIAVTQNEETGLIQLDGKDAEYWVTLRDTVTRLLADDPKMSVNAMKDVLLDLTSHKKGRQVTTDINTYLIELGLKQPKKKS